jgi:hypothetical protein
MALKLQQGARGGMGLRTALSIWRQGVAGAAAVAPLVPAARRGFRASTSLHALQAGIVGLPNVGKSTLFNAIVENGKAAVRPSLLPTLFSNLARRLGRHSLAIARLRPPPPPPHGILPHETPTLAFSNTFPNPPAAPRRPPTSPSAPSSPMWGW